MALGVDEQRLLAGQRALHRPLQEVGGEGGLGLVGHVLLAAERPAVGHQLHLDPVDRQAEHRGDLVPVVPHALAAGPDLEDAVGPGRGQRRLGLEEGLLDPLGLERLPHDVGRRRQRGLDVAAPGVGRAGQLVAVQLPHGVLVGGQRGVGVDHRRQHLVVHLDQGGRPLGRGPVAGHDDGQHVAEVRRPPALGDEHRPVLVDQPDPQLARDVGRGQDRLDPGHGRRRGGVDAQDVGPGVVGQPQDPVEQALGEQVVDERPAAGRQRRALVLDRRRADAAGQRWARGTRPGPASRWRRGSSRSRCTGTGGRRGGGPPSPGSAPGPCRAGPSSAPGSPGVQNPHCSAPAAAKASA